MPGRARAGDAAPVAVDVERVEARVPLRATARRRCRARTARIARRQDARSGCARSGRRCARQGARRARGCRAPAPPPVARRSAPSGRHTSRAFARRSRATRRPMHGPPACSGTSSRFITVVSPPACGKRIADARGATRTGTRAHAGTVLRTLGERRGNQRIDRGRKLQRRRSPTAVAAARGRSR